MHKYFLILILGSLFLIPSCSNDDDDSTIAPKPRGFFRLTFPEKKYVSYSAACPFSFDIPAYTKMENDSAPRAEPCWLNLQYPSLHATIHLSYRQVNGDLNTLLEDTYTLASKHTIKSSGIQEEVISKDSNKVYGLIYNIGGNAASSIQFFVTDSTKNFVRGALYFYAVPNTDSIKPAVDFVREDIYHLIQTFHWKNSDIVFPSLGNPKTVNKKQSGSK